MGGGRSPHEGVLVSSFTPHFGPLTRRMNDSPAIPASARPAPGESAFAVEDRLGVTPPPSPQRLRDDTEQPGVFGHPLGSIPGVVADDAPSNDRSFL